MILCNVELQKASPTGLLMSELSVVDPPEQSTLTPRKAAPVNPFFKPGALVPPLKDEEPVAPGIASERKQLDEGYAEIRWPDEIGKDSFEEFEYWLTGVLNRARRKAGIGKEKPQGQKS